MVQLAVAKILQPGYDDRRDGRLLAIGSNGRRGNDHRRFAFIEDRTAGAAIITLSLLRFRSPASALRRADDQASLLPAPPVAEQRPYSYERHGETISDPWHWLRDPQISRRR